MFVLHIQQTVKSGFFQFDPALSERGLVQVICTSVFPLQCLVVQWCLVIYVTYVDMCIFVQHVFTLTLWSYIAPWPHWPLPSLRAKGTSWTRGALRANNTVLPISSWHSTKGQLYLSHIAGIR